ncbi:MAG: hypothetical protein RL508_233 [Actinomycetota bacterium]|jgi:uncharacterized membrane protein
MVYLEVGLVITFSQAHTYGVGIMAITSFGIGYAMVSVLVALIQRKKMAAYESVPLTVVALGIGLAATQLNSHTEVFWYPMLIVIWGLASAGFEWQGARKLGYRTQSGSEHLISAVLGLLLGLLYAFVRLQEIDAVGFLGAYMILSAVHLGISAVSARKN